MRTCIAILATLCALPLRAAETEPAGWPAVSLESLAERADLVALVQVRDTDYLKRREIPVSGSAYLKVLIPYKADQSADLVEVYEKGLHAGECYFPDRTVFEEGRRYLVFLVRDPEDDQRYRGLREGCALDILVRSDNRYALRYPPTGIQLSDVLKPLAREMDFTDPYAVVADESLSSAQRDRMRDDGDIIPFEAPAEKADSGDERWLPPSESGNTLWRFTRGVPLGEVRRLLGLNQETSR